uniref:NADH-ubiquinone oxidoreductase chain 5 n=1 Tax=Nallachius americanus TaxID=560880 RepID=A0A1S5QY29_9NEOP|nr:NADH dehydrogenase subunit 5 [Nallachius americanus]
MKKICFNSFIFLLMIALSMIMLSLMFILQDKVIFIEWDLLSLNSCNLVMTVLLDWMSLLFMGFVLMISSFVIYYSTEYMEGDMNMNRFIILVLLFVFSMMMLIISPNLISILLGWDGLGLVSYCLVIYYQNVKSYNAGMITALSNRVGDVALLLSIALMMGVGSWNYLFYFEWFGDLNEFWLISMFIILAAMTKSAQIPFSAWLPAAMAAPTPVSALVHSSTLVTAGVYLLIRFGDLLFSSGLLSVLLLIGGLTMFMSGLGANYENDLKKIIALSTLSQLGLMVSILSLGYFKLAFFHLLTHALFKALLFMCAGAVIHNVKGLQDLRGMGGVINYLPMTLGCMNIANMALMGMPFLAGFYSKDLILEMCLMSNLNLLTMMLFFISTGLTVSYSFRLMYYLMYGGFNFDSLHLLDHEGGIMTRSMLVLTMMSVMGGSMLMWLVMPTPSFICLTFYLKMLTMTVCLIGVYLGVVIYSFKNEFVFLKKMSVYIFHFLGSMWFMPQIFTSGVSFSILKLGGGLIRNMEMGWSEVMSYKLIMSGFKNFVLINQVLQGLSFKSYFMLCIYVVIIFIMMIMISL